MYIPETSVFTKHFTHDHLDDSIVNGDMLSDIFHRQHAMNELALRPMGSEHADLCDAIQAMRKNNSDVFARDKIGEWCKKFTKAMSEEVKELDDEFPWKWWSKDPIDMQNARVEIVDILHFLVSLAITTGMTSQELHSLYRKKWQVNIDRQKNGYSKASKAIADDNVNLHPDTTNE